MRFMFVFALAMLFLAPSAWSQPQLANVYHTDNNDGTVYIFAENHGFVPYTIFFEAQLVNMKCSDPLPGRFVVFPSKSPRVITSFTYVPGQLYSYRYSNPYQLGIYASHPADSSYEYTLPFRRAGVAQHFTHITKRHESHHHYFFNLADGVPLRAARAGIIATFLQDLPVHKNSKSTFLVIFHEDGTYAYYVNFKQNSVAVQLGQRVEVGDILASAGGLKRHWFQFRVQQPGPHNAEEIPVNFSGNSPVSR
ncbi:MAG: M23 family metallopeptidase [Bacteroidota bacterium]|nr:M23 family metallopeptidase [Bacteroidota bacterium]